MKRIQILSIIVISLLCINECNFAQSERLAEGLVLPVATHVEKKDSLLDVSSTEAKIIETQSKTYCDSLSILITERNSIIALKTAQIDSLNLLLQFKENEIKKLTEERAFVDTCMARLANRWLYEKFNEQDVNSAIEYFNKILSTQLRRDHSIILELLKSYKSAYMDFQKLLRSAQMDTARKNLFRVTDYKTRYKYEIETMPYYVRYYNNSWNIRYLNERIKMAMERIEMHSEEKPADFSDLID